MGLVVKNYWGEGGSGLEQRGGGLSVFGSLEMGGSFKFQQSMGVGYPVL